MHFWTFKFTVFLPQKNECVSQYKVVGTKPYIEISRLENVTPLAKELKP